MNLQRIANIVISQSYDTAFILGRGNVRFSSKVCTLYPSALDKLVPYTGMKIFVKKYRANRPQIKYAL